MNLIELNRSLRQLRPAAALRCWRRALQQAKRSRWPPSTSFSCLVSMKLTRRGDRLLERRRKQAQISRSAGYARTNFDFNFNKKMNRSLVFDLATATLSLAAKMHFPRSTRHREKPSGPGHRASPSSARGYRVIYP